MTLTRSRVRPAIALFMIASILTVAPATTAQDDSGCLIPPLTLPLWDATPPAIIAATPAAIPDDEVTVEEIEAAIESIVACLNTGEARFIYAVFTDRYLASRYADPDETYLPALEQEIDRNAIAQTDVFTLESIADIEFFDDGRVAVTITLVNDDQTWSDTLVLAKQDDIWRIDDMIALDPPDD